MIVKVMTQALSSEAGVKMNSTNKSKQRIETNEISLWADGLERGTNMAEFVRGNMADLRDAIILDLGCGLGGISISFAQRAKLVLSGDLDMSRLSKVKERIENSRIKNMCLLKFEGKSLPFKDETFDLVIMNGVLEYMGINKTRLDPEQLQIVALQETRRVLKKNGKVYIGIENRWYPAYFFRDVHCGLPLVAMLPRKMASLISFVLSRKPFQTYIHSYWNLRKMLEKAGFSENTFFVPLFNYQYPLVIKAISERKDIIRTLLQIGEFNAPERYKKMSFGNTPRLKAKLFLILARVGLLKLLSPCFVVLASKGENR